jgi:hypothetical protein
MILILSLKYTDKLKWGDVLTLCPYPLEFSIVLYSPIIICIKLGCFSKRKKERLGHPWMSCLKLEFERAQKLVIKIGDFQNWIL